MSIPHHYEINVSLKGNHVFLVRLPDNTDEKGALWHLDEMSSRYPAKSGYLLELNGEYRKTIARSMTMLWDLDI